jgi:hypothetical protein
VGSIGSGKDRTVTGVLQSVNGSYSTILVDKQPYTVWTNTLKLAGEVSEEKPSAGLSKEKKSEVVKKAKAGEDIGKEGKGFEKVAQSAGGGEKGEKIAAAAMWKNIKR